MTDLQKHIQTVRMALEEWRNGLHPREADEVFTALSALDAIAAAYPQAQESRPTHLKIRLRNIVHALQGASGNTDTDPRWLAQNELRKWAYWNSNEQFLWVHNERILPPAPIKETK